MRYAVQNDLEMVQVYGHQLLTAAFAIAAGVSFVTICRELRSVKG